MEGATNRDRWPPGLSEIEKRLCQVLARGKRALPSGDEGGFKDALYRDKMLKRYVKQSWQWGTTDHSSRLGEPGKPGLALNTGLLEPLLPKQVSLPTI